MTISDDTTEHNFLTPQEIRNWLLQELRDSAKAHELRTKEATELATAYALGELSPAQANEMFLQYNDRWGETLPKTHAFKGATDDQILASIDKAQGDHHAPRILREKVTDQSTKTR